MADERFRLFDMGERPELRTALEEEPAPAPTAAESPPAPPVAPTTPVQGTPLPAGPQPIPPLPPIQAQGDPLSLLMMIHGVTDPRAAAVGNVMMQQARQRAEAQQTGQAIAPILEAMGRNEPQRAQEILNAYLKDPNLSPTAKTALIPYGEKLASQQMGRAQTGALADVLEARYKEQGVPMPESVQRLTAMMRGPSGVELPQAREMLKQLMPEQVKIGDTVFSRDPVTGTGRAMFGGDQIVNHEGTIVRVGARVASDGTLTYITEPLYYIERPLVFDRLSPEVQNILQSTPGFDRARYNAGVQAAPMSPQRQDADHDLQRAQAQALVMSRNPAVSENARALLGGLGIRYDPLRGIEQLDQDQMRSLLGAEAKQKADNAVAVEAAHYRFKLQEPLFLDPRFKDVTLVDRQTFAPRDPNMTVADYMRVADRYALVPRKDMALFGLVGRVRAEADALERLVPQVLTATSDQPLSPLIQRVELAIKRGAVNPAALQVFDFLNQALALGLGRVESGSGRILTTVYKDVRDRQIPSTANGREAALALTRLIRWNAENYLRSETQQPQIPVPDALLGAAGIPGTTPTGAVMPTFGPPR